VAGWAKERLQAMLPGVSSGGVTVTAVDSVTGDAHIWCVAAGPWGPAGGQLPPGCDAGTCSPVDPPCSHSCTSGRGACQARHLQAAAAATPGLIWRSVSAGSSAARSERGLI
jgi:hypothetical protein